ncbi:Gfo/Idh/MocA family oxidoreductase [Streptococcus didelphis]|uniref:Gfo/Idh/MocA family oxidoreductase n=1 Tax=Streptococcus didelphis TaxID=102886 RepID=A0ABY9LI39_9STRE|nr:Gfo/Idh/MocA family oxidoreductase [Streptococcus didelphis]WMB28520.1 Gfo/Idh/MocA family oxidoreductase [Streptococcus didelphis]
MKLAILGTGMIVKDALPVLSAIEGIDLKAIVSTQRSIETAQLLAQKFEIEEASYEYEKVLTNPEIDTVYVATPNHLHYQMAKQALLAGKHVICEKPFTLALADLEELASIAQQKQVFLLEAITNQYLENFTYIKEHLAQLGEIKIVECNYSQYSSRYDDFKQGRIAPAFDVNKGGGALRDLNIYNIHIVVGLFGKPDSVLYLPNIDNKVDTSGILILDYPTFKVACIGAKDCSAAIKSTIQGNKGSISILGATNAMPELSVALNGQDEKRIQENKEDHRMTAEFKVFKEIIETKDSARASEALNHSLAVMEVLEKASQSLL